MSAPQISLTARLSPSALDTRRGLVRLHPEVLDALGLRAWDAVRLTGARVSSALAAAADRASAPGIVLVDDVTMSNVGVTEGAEIVVAPVEVAAARSVTVAGSRLVQALLAPDMVRLALIGKVITTGDAVSLLPQDLAPAPGSDVTGVRRLLSNVIGMAWTSELITISDTEPAGPVAVGPSSVFHWRDGPTAPTAPPAPTRVELPAIEPVPVPPVTDLVGADEAVRRLTEWFELTFRRPELLRRLGSPARLGALVSGPEGVGKSTLVRAVTGAVGAALIELAAPGVSALEANAAAASVRAAVAAAIAATADGTPAVLLLTDIDVLLPASNPQPVSTVVLDTLRAAVRAPLVALVCTSSHSGSVDHRLRDPDVVDRELTLPAPDARARVEQLRVLLRRVPVESDVDFGAVAERTPGFVVADLGALCREAAVRAAIRQR
ncbi:MAG TPA: AAA family ATPase, partial [Pseudonocardiaceae bacterium]